MGGERLSGPPSGPANMAALGERGARLLEPAEDSSVAGGVMLDAKRILVAVNGNATDTTIVMLAAHTAKRTKGHIYAIHVIEVRRTLPLDADLPEERQRADGILDTAEHAAEDLGQTLETEILQARDIGTAIVEEAIESRAELVLLGIPYRRKFGEFDLGRTVPYVLKNAPCEVWVCREPMAAK
ncbi:MAG: universal stress protein [Chloroflexi bacterium]|nr:universal stress protein [Chloroflexota bacterium]